MQQTDTLENIAAAAIHSAAKETDTARDDMEHHGRSVRAFIAVVVLFLLLDLVDCLSEKTHSALRFVATNKTYEKDNCMFDARGWFCRHNF